MDQEELLRLLLVLTNRSCYVNMKRVCYKSVVNSCINLFITSCKGGLMMVQMSISEYANKTGVTRQAVYARIRRGTLEASMVNDVWVINVDDSDVNVYNNGSKTIDDGNGSVDNSVDDGIDAGLLVLQEKYNGSLSKIEGLQGEVKYLRERIINLESLLDRQTEIAERHTLLLAQEQASRIKALPRPAGWIRRIFSLNST